MLKEKLQKDLFFVNIVTEYVIDSLANLLIDSLKKRSKFFVETMNK
jgi:hypothetical protein